MDGIKLKENAIIYLKIIVGYIIYAASFRFFIYPNDVVLGGVVGIATILNYLTDLPVGVMTIVFNIPLFIFSWRHLGLKFLISSLIAMLERESLSEWQLYAALTEGKPMEVTLEQVRRQIMIIEESHKQNPLPKKVTL